MAGEIDLMINLVLMINFYLKLSSVFYEGLAIVGPTT